ncbi:MAG: hypothetical protein IJ009_02655 [Clostridia bacterium]|nr:hypothetical protein [Clostridia bacterium]
MKKGFILMLIAALLLTMTFGTLLMGCDTPGDDPVPPSGGDDGDKCPTCGKNPCECPADEGTSIDLVLFIGQSNMAGRGDATTATQVAEGHAYEFRAISDPTKLYHLAEPFGVNENNETSGITETTKTGSMVSAFCEAYYAVTNTPIVGVSCSKGGQKISVFDTDGAAYADAVARVNSAKDFIAQEYANGNSDMKVRNTYVVWLQGESDGDVGTTAADYTATLDRIVKGFKQDIGAAQTFIIPIGVYNGKDDARNANYTAIRDAQKAYCEGNADATVISNLLVDFLDLGYMKDQFHFTQEGYELVGYEAGTNMAHFVTTGTKPEC